MKHTGDKDLNAYSNAATTSLSFGLHPGTRETQTPQKRKARILVVDDDPGLLRLLTIRLRAENYEVEAVESAAAALAACVRFRPDLVITDLRMDQMDGIGLLKELQSRWPGLRVIILTAHGTIPDAVHATQSGAFGFLTKPVDKQDLLDHVQKALKVSGFAHVDEDWRSSIITRMSPRLRPSTGCVGRSSGWPWMAWAWAATAVSGEASCCAWKAGWQNATLMCANCGCREAIAPRASLGAWPYRCCSSWAV